MTRHRAWLRSGGASSLAMVILLAGCTVAPPPASLAPVPPPPPVAPAVPDLAETPPPAGGWREHRLARCREDLDVPVAVEKLLTLASEMFRDRSGSDAIVELEFAWADGQRHPLFLATLGQLYLLAGQGDATLLPNEGPARDVGPWAKNQPRLLGRARLMLEEAARQWGDDAGLAYLLSDVALAAGDTAAAADLWAGAAAKCTGGRTFRMMQLYQHLNRIQARHEGGPAPEYPAAAMDRREQGEVVVDLLLDPASQVRQVAVVSAPSTDLAEAAVACLRQGRFAAARLGRYPVWGWVRVTVAFRLES